MESKREGRIDIVIFPNGKREVIGRIDSSPALPLDEVLEAADSFIEDQGKPDNPVKATGYYSVNASGQIEITWYEYQGEIEAEEYERPNEFELRWGD